MGRVARSWRNQILLNFRFPRLSPKNYRCRGRAPCLEERAPAIAPPGALAQAAPATAATTASISARPATPAAPAPEAHTPLPGTLGKQVVWLK